MTQFDITRSTKLSAIGNASISPRRNSTFGYCSLRTLLRAFAMIAKARNNVRKEQYPNVEFRLGEIEALPIADNFVDLVISNCVINLSPEKPRVFSGSVPGPQTKWPACHCGCSRHQTNTGEQSNAIERDRSMHRRGRFS